MQRHTLTAGIESALAADLPENVGTSSSISYGRVPSEHYKLLLQLISVANLWQVIQFAKVAWDAADPDSRSRIDTSVIKHLTNCWELYVGACRQHKPLINLSQQEMLEHDTASHGAGELERLGLARSPSTEQVFALINQRIDELSESIPPTSSLRGIDWRPPAILNHSPVFHLEFGSECLELRFTVS